MGIKSEGYKTRLVLVNDINTVTLIDSLTSNNEVFNEKLESVITGANVTNKPPPDFFKICKSG